METKPKSAGNVIVGVSTVVAAVMAVLSFFTTAAQVQVWLVRIGHVWVRYGDEILQALFIMTLLIMLGTRLLMLRTFQTLHRERYGGY